MSSPAHPLFRPPAAALRTSGAATADPRLRLPGPGTARPASTPVTPRLPRARSSTRGTPRDRPLGHDRDDTALVITELAADAMTRAAPRCTGAPDVRPGFRPAPGHPPPTVADPDDHPPVRGAGSGPKAHGRGPRIVDVPPEEAGPVRRPSGGQDGAGPVADPSPHPTRLPRKGTHAMRSASTERPSSERPVRHTPPTGVARTTPLTALSRVPWADMQDSTGSAAAIPLLLNGIAWGDAGTARAALADLRKRICQYGFVTEQATAATVPFLWELAQLPHVACRAGIIQLLKAIADARQWESTAAAYPKLLNRRENPVVWERAARQAVRARRGDLNRLLAEPDTEIARATTELARALAD